MAAIDPSYQLLACQFLRKQLDALTKELAGVRENTAIEPVHQARVASRRMRAALRMFADCFDSKKMAKWQKQVKRLTRGLGAARDLDVQIAFLETTGSALDPADRKQRPGIKRLLLRLQQERAAIQPKVLKTLDGLDKGNVLAEMYGEMEMIRFMLRTRAVCLQSPFVFEQAAAHIRQRQGDLLACERTLADPRDAGGHHQMRIAAKRLRYTMEICDPAYRNQIKPAIKAIKRVQTLLGDIHDCDVWDQNIEAFMEQERRHTIAYYGHHRPFNRLRPGLLYVQEERRSHRERTFIELVEYWERLGADHLWDNLETTLQSYIDVSHGPDAETTDRPVNGTEEETHDNRPDQ